MKRDHRYPPKSNNRKLVSLLWWYVPVPKILLEPSSYRLLLGGTSMNYGSDTASNTHRTIT